MSRRPTRRTLARPTGHAGRARVRWRPWAPLLCATLVGGCLKVPETTAERPDEAAAATPESAAAALVWPGKPAGELYKLGEVRSFRIMRDGAHVGTSHGRYEGPVAGEVGHHRFSTRVELFPPNTKPEEIGEVAVRALGEVIVDERGGLVRGFERSAAAELSFAREGEALVFESGRVREELTYRDGTAFMSYWTFLHEELMLALRPLTTGQVGWRQISLSRFAPVEWSATVRAPTRERPNVIALSTSLGERIDFDQRTGRIERIQIDAESVDVVPADPEWPTWTIAAPEELRYVQPPGSTFSIAKVELPGRPGEPRLFGDVLVPNAPSGPRPAVLFISANGRQDRHGFAGPPPVDLGSHELTDHLANAGFVVLRFDERGFGESEDGPISYNGQLEDARRALRTLLVQESVDPDRVAIVGHGEGGWRALTLASKAEGKRVKAVALLSTPGRPYEEILGHQSEHMISRLPPEMRKDARAQHRRVVRALRTGDSVPASVGEQAVWIREALAVDPSALIAGLEDGCALWISQGDRDFEVDPEADPNALLRFTRRHRKKATLRRYPLLDHLYKVEQEQSTPERYLEPGRRVDDGFLADLSKWLGRSLGVKRRPRTQKK